VPGEWKVWTRVAVLPGAISIVTANRAQATMGAAWRTGIADGDGAGRLVTTGLFGVVRNPVCTTMVASSVGVALLVPPRSWSLLPRSA
jgi:protein-S-isoprenylcysteine O-methyltransferase Ste14